MSEIEAVLLWVGRALSVIPAFKSLWEAANSGTPEQELAASLELVRAIKTKQAAEEIAGP